MDTKILCVDFAKRFVQENHRFPTAQDWKISSGFPCAAKMIEKLFGSWVKFRIAAGEPLFHPVYGDYGDIEVTRHVCHNKKCVNPAHLLPGTRSENALDSRENNKQTKLTKAIVRELRQAQLDHSEVPIMKFCETWGQKLKMTPGAIWAVIKGRCWKDVI